MHAPYAILLHVAIIHITLSFRRPGGIDADRRHSAVDDRTDFPSYCDPRVPDRRCVEEWARPLTEMKIHRAGDRTAIR
nr:MAG: hypothetical protein DIU55_03510 [Bacillota bacterium]